MKTLSKKNKQIFKKVLLLSNGKYKSQYKEIFRNKNRVEIPVGSIDYSSSKNYKLIKNFLNENGYEIDDYVEGYALKKGDKNRVKIGKLIKDNKYLSDNFRDCECRQKTKLVLSKHPYDMACASYEQKWGSCLNIQSGAYRDKLITSITSGTGFIAYNVSVNSGEVMGRCFVIPYINKSTGLRWLKPASEAYGIFSTYLQDYLEDWLNYQNNQYFLKNAIPSDSINITFNFPCGLFYDNGDIKSYTIKNTKYMLNCNKLRELINTKTKRSFFVYVRNIINTLAERGCDNINSINQIKTEITEYINYHSPYKKIDPELKYLIKYIEGDHLDDTDYIDFITKYTFKINKIGKKTSKYILKKNSLYYLEKVLKCVDNTIQWGEAKAKINEFVKDGVLNEKSVKYERLLKKIT